MFKCYADALSLYLGYASQEKLHGIHPAIQLEQAILGSDAGCSYNYCS